MLLSNIEARRYTALSSAGGLSLAAVVCRRWIDPARARMLRAWGVFYMYRTSLPFQCHVHSRHATGCRNTLMLSKSGRTGPVTDINSSANYIRSFQSRAYVTTGRTDLPTTLCDRCYWQDIDRFVSQVMSQRSDRTWGTLLSDQFGMAYTALDLTGD